MFQMRCGKACRLSLSVKLEVHRTSSFDGEGFNIVCAKPPLRRVESRFAEPRFNFWEGFNFVSGMICCSALIRGSQNLDVLCKENGLSLFASCKK